MITIMHLIHPIVFEFWSCVSHSAGNPGGSQGDWGKVAKLKGKIPVWALGNKWKGKQSVKESVQMIDGFGFTLRSVSLAFYLLV